MSEDSRSTQKTEDTKVFAGRYAYQKPLGRGAGGSVYLAEDLHSERRKVALKVLSEEACDTVQGKMLRREFEILSKLDHPNLVRGYDYGKLPDGGVYLAEEYIDGFSLQDARALLEPEALIDPTLQILQGLAYLHGMSMIHRDIKPANVMLLWLDDASARPMVKLVDFGLSSMDPKRDTLRGGTRSYMAPEIIRGDKGEYRSDLYSLGVTLYYALCGVLPWGPRSKEDPPPTDEQFRPPDPHRLNDQVPLALSRFTMALLRQVPDVEYTDAGEALQALAADAGELEARSVGQMANSLDVSAAPVIRGYFERGILSRRVEEDDLLLEWLSMSDDPSMGRMYLIRGEQGVGKSRLISDVQASAKLSGHLVLSHRCRDLQGPYSLLVEIVDRLLEIASSHDVRALDNYRADLEIRKVLTRLEMVTAGNGARPIVEQQWMRKAIEEAVSVFAPQQVVLFIDDIDEADESSREIIYEWFRPSKSQHRPSIVATSGPGEFFDSFCRQAGVEVLPIEGVGVDDVRTFFSSQLGIDELSDRWLEEVAQAARGRPAYIGELCRYLIDAGMLWRNSANDWGARLEDIEAAEVPETLRESLRRRISEVGAAGRECLELLAVMDRPLSWKGARRLLERGGSSSDEAQQTLQTVHWRHLITTELTEGGRYVRVVHGELADAVADMLSPQWRRALHRRIGQQISRDWGRGQGDALEAATHLLAGRQQAEAAPFFEIAAELAVTEGRPEEAKDHYKRAFEGSSEVPARALISIRRAEVELLHFDARTARKHLRRAVRLAEHSTLEWLQYRTYVDASAIEYSLGDLEGARELLGRCRESLPAMRQEIDLSVMVARTAIRGGDLDRAEAVMTRCINERRLPMLPGRLVEVLDTTAQLHLLRGRRDKALKTFRRARNRAKSGDDRSVEARVLLNYGIALRRLDSPTEAAETLRDALPVLARRGRPDELIGLLLQLAWTFVELGAVSKAHKRADEAHCLTRRLNHTPYRQLIDVFRSGLALRASSGDDEAIDEVEHLVNSVDHADDFVVDRAELMMALGDLMIALQCRDRGPKLLQRGRQIAFEIGARGLLPPMEE